jgi:hypothetical protein
VNSAGGASFHRDEVQTKEMKFRPSKIIATHCGGADPAHLDRRRSGGRSRATGGAGARCPSSPDSGDCEANSSRLRPALCGLRARHCTDQEVGHCRSAPPAGRTTATADKLSELLGLIEHATDADVTHAAILKASAVKSLHELNPRQCRSWIDNLTKKLAERQNDGKKGRK